MCICLWSLHLHAALWVLIVFGPCCCSFQLAQTLVYKVRAFPAVLFCAFVCRLALQHVSDGKCSLLVWCSLYSCAWVVFGVYSSGIEALIGVVCAALMHGPVANAGQYSGQLHVWRSCAFCSCQLWLLAALLARVGLF